MATMIQTLTRDIRALDEKIQDLQKRRTALAATLEHYSGTSQDSRAMPSAPKEQAEASNKPGLKDRLVAYLTEHGPANAPTLAKALGVPQQTSIHRAVTQLEAMNKVRRMSDRTIALYEAGE